MPPFLLLLPDIQPPNHPDPDSDGALPPSGEDDVALIRLEEVEGQIEASIAALQRARDELASFKAELEKQIFQSRGNNVKS